MRKADFPSFGASPPAAPRSAPKPNLAAENAPEVLQALQRGVDLQRQRKFIEAERIYQGILHRLPEHPDALHLMGTLAVEANQMDVAVDYFERAVKRRPRHPHYLGNLGTAYLDSGNMDEAIATLRKAVEAAPSLIEALCNLARAYRRNSKASNGLPFLERAERIAADHPLVAVGFGETLRDLGRMDEAAAHFRRAIAAGHSLPRAYQGLSSTRKFNDGDPELAELAAIITRTGLSDGERESFHHALGKMCNDARRYDDAMMHFRTAKEISGRRFNIVQYRKAIDTLAGLFTPLFFHERKGFGDPSELPVFIIGMPRSGTTLTEQIAASHPEVHGAGELSDIRQIASMLGFAYAHPENFVAGLKAMTAGQSREIAGRYLRRLRKQSVQAARVTDKMPHNFEMLGLIALLFPKARIVHCRRDAIDTCVSCFMNQFSETHGYNADLTNVGLYYREYDRLMGHWRRVLPLPILEHSYEELTDAQEPASRRLIAHLGLDWNDACLNYHETDRTVGTISRWQVRQPIYKSSVRRWANYEAHLAPLFTALGDLAVR
ncbi:tetratricopeptide repeat-containing sulfotransferase family protein [Taklimakanibacter lacteus]|uniref:tetratricopeptide repeat-containing sulfotransferase family protein n=1 Tax=Taklimakanibacter lacteus TaxID=2268456 RepID=UPI0013C53A4D